VSERDIGQELLEGVRAIKRGEGKHRKVEMPTDVRVIRERAGLSQMPFAALLGVSTPTLQDWEQRRRHPSGPALSLLRIADKHPEALFS
jgi:putative transcriptional regulator